MTSIMTCLRWGGDAKHFDIWNVVLLFEEGFQVHLQQAGMTGQRNILPKQSSLAIVGNSKVERLGQVLTYQHDRLFQDDNLNYKYHIFLFQSLNKTWQIVLWLGVF